MDMDRPGPKESPWTLSAHLERNYTWNYELDKICRRWRRYSAGRYSASSAGFNLEEIIE